MSLMMKAKYFLKRSSVVYKIMHPFHKAYRQLTMRSAQWRQGVDPKKVVFSSFFSRSYADNPRYISEKLHELCPEAKIVWMFRQETIDRVQVPDYVKKVLAISREGMVEQATARFLVDNFKRTESMFLNTDKQYYIQTWHGDRGFKRVGDDNEKTLYKHIRRIEDKCAMMIAGSEFGRNTYRTAFHFQGEVLMDGCPRNDILLRNDPAEAARFRSRLDIAPDVRLLLYAPTYRDKFENAKQEAVLDVSRTLDHLEKTRGEKWLCLCRAHYLNRGLIVQEDSRIRDVSDWPEMAELLLISDMLITDYSSCAGDFALLRRPVFLYHADAEEYLRESRSFYFNIEDSPFLVARSQEELEKLIDETDAERARENGEALDRFFGTTETGHASEAVCRYIMERMKD